MKSLLTFLAVLTALFLISPSADAVQFSSNSAKITNPYLPLKVGIWGYSKGVGNNWHGQINYFHAIGTETVSGAQIGGQVFNNVKSLKVNIAETDKDGSNDHNFLTLSFAQDTDGNVWVLKGYSHIDDQTFLLGGLFKSMFMPAVPAVDDPAAITVPEDTDNYCRVVQVGIDSKTTTFGTYSNCIEVRCYHANPSNTEIEYYCQGVGTVRSSNTATPNDFIDLKEYGEATAKRTVVIPLFD